MSTRLNLLFAAMTALSIGMCAGSALANGGESKPSTQKVSLTASVDEEKARQREEEMKLVEWARKERERKAAEEEKLRATRRQRAEETISGAQGACTIKPVMSDSEIEACRRAGR